MASLEEFLERLSIFSKAEISLRAESRPGLLECKKFYKKQSRHTLGEERDRRRVPIHISGNVHPDWIPFLKQGIAEINEACPGLHLFQTGKSESEVMVVGSSSDEGAYTQGNIVQRRRNQVLISLYDGWESKKRTSVHELLHALGAQHEHQANDATSFVDYNPDDSEGNDDYQCQSMSDFIKVTRRDPFSIMMYQEGCGSCLTRKAGNDLVWNLKEPGEMNNEMSELDKVGLNQMYPPCRSAAYNPVRSPETRMWYCGRAVMKNHNRPAESTTDNCCGPKDWANCPACRSLKNTMVDYCLSSRERWQGWSGLVYCGGYFGVQGPGHDGYCGPNNGPSCPQCAMLLLSSKTVLSYYSTAQ